MMTPEQIIELERIFNQPLEHFTRFPLVYAGGLVTATKIFSYFCHDIFVYKKILDKLVSKSLTFNNGFHILSGSETSRIFWPVYVKIEDRKS